jgi:L,D-transpeptidase YcbB
MFFINLEKWARYCSTVLFCCFITNGIAQQTSVVSHSMVKSFYTLNHKHLYWFSSNNTIKSANDWLTQIESARNLGLVPDTLRISILRSVLFNNTLDSLAKSNADRQITDVVLAFIKVLQEGNIKFEYDEVSVSRDSIYVYQLFNAKPGESVSKIITRLDCKDRDYTVLKKHLQNLLVAGDTLKYKKVMLAMNYRRYLTLNHQSEYIIVNIPAAEAYYYKADKQKITMRTVMGKRSKPTPVFASYITSIIPFPYWNVPHSIAVKELLPKVQKDDNYLEQNNFDVVDAKGNVIDDSDLK